MAAVLDQLLVRVGLKKQPRLHRSREQVAASVPVRNKLVEWQREENGEISLTIPADQKRHLRFLIRVMDLPDKRVIALDEVGSFVWEKCDGESTFGEIVDQLTQKFQMTPREADASLAEYFRLLGRRGMVGFIVSDAVAKQPPNASVPRSKDKRRGR